MIKFNRWRFFSLILLSHLGLLYFVCVASFGQIMIAALIFLILCSFASTAIYHRLLSHRSWNAPRWVECLGAILGIFSFTGTPITRTLSHRYHHKYTETHLDPHSPVVLGPLIAYFPMLYGDRNMDIKLVKDIIRDPVHAWLHRHYLDVIIATWVLSFLFLGLTWTLVLFVVPGALNWMNISICNILCHLGKTEVIINSKWLAFITFGEGFHKNHHANPDSPDFSGHGSWLDMGYFWVWLFSKRV